MPSSPAPEAVGTTWTRHNLSDHDDVDQVADTDKQVMSWDATAGKWVGTTIATLHGGVTLFGYAGDPNTHVTSLRIGDLCVDFTNGVLYQSRAVGTTWVKASKPLVVPAITGALSTVADAPAKAVLTSIIAALVSDGFATDGTT